MRFTKSVSTLKKDILLRNLMVLIAIVLLLVGCIPGIVTRTSMSDNGAVIVEEHSFFTLQPSDAPAALPFFLLTSLMCVGSVAFRISKAGKPLDWTLAASTLGVAADMLLLFPQENDAQLHISILVLILCMTELALAIVYKIGRHIGFLI